LNLNLELINTIDCVHRGHKYIKLLVQNQARQEPIHQEFQLLVCKSTEGIIHRSGNEDTDTTSGSDSLLGESSEFLGLNDTRSVGESSITEHLEVAL
jgi:hypothetical protein